MYREQRYIIYIEYERNMNDKNINLNNDPRHNIQRVSLFCPKFKTECYDVEDCDSRNSIFS